MIEGPLGFVVDLICLIIFLIVTAALCIAGIVVCIIPLYLGWKVIMFIVGVF